MGEDADDKSYLQTVVFCQSCNIRPHNLTDEEADDFMYAHATHSADRRYVPVNCTCGDGAEIVWQNHLDTCDFFNANAPKTSFEHEPFEDAIGVGLYAGPCRHCKKWVNFKPVVHTVEQNGGSNRLEEGKTYLLKKIVGGPTFGPGGGVFATYLLQEVEPSCRAHEVKK